MSSYILFLDGDMELLPGFLNNAISELENNKDIAAVAGQMHNYFYDDSGYLANKELDVYDLTKNIPGGAFLIRKNLFLNVGGFNSDLVVNEESELFFRLSRKGFLFKRIFTPMINHHTEVPTSGMRLKDRLKDRKITALSKNFIVSLSSPAYFFEFLMKNRYTFLYSLGIIVSMVFVSAGIMNIGVYLLFLIFLFVSFMVKSFRISFNYLVYGFGFLLGLVFDVIDRTKRVILK
ncbi:hypothetical protein A8C75_00950 [Marinobacterium aestuarii]|uniref:Glycosyltransferase 2-like domain-containing protein n=2 Tax=Marinobacterium aestuarii TaxID=1821621 RepID=A0A1A9ETQ4_9GAMM|nr:hypothetical protein A8C75_00950 [Marinobacterium aestuarii]